MVLQVGPHLRGSTHGACVAEDTVYAVGAPGFAEAHGDRAGRLRTACHARLPLQQGRRPRGLHAVHVEE